MNPILSPPPRRALPPAEHPAPDPIEHNGGRLQSHHGQHSKKLDFVIFNLVIPIAILLLGALAWHTFGKQEAAVRPAEDGSWAARLERIPAAKALPVRSLDAVGGQLNLEVDGVVVPFREVQIATEVAGQIVYKAPQCEAGTYVEKGQLLFRIDPTDYQNEIDRLTQLKEQEYQSIRELDQEMVNTSRLIEIAKKDVELQEREIARLRSLPAGFASEAELDQAQQNRLQAVNTRVTLENEVALIRRRRSRLEAAEQLVVTQIEMAKTNLERTQIHAPVSGVIFREDAELNSFIQRGEVIITIEDTSKAEIAVNLRTDQLYWVLDQARQGSQSLVPAIAGDARSYSLPETQATIRYRVAGREDEVFQWEGRLERYDGIGVDQVSRTVPVRLVVDEPRRYRLSSEAGDKSIPLSGPSALVRGMFVTVVLHIEPQRPLVVVPAIGLKPGNRIWKFIPDPSVLEGGAGARQADTEGEFQPGNWVPGRVQVLEDLRPIESSKLVHGLEDDGQLAADGNSDYWICEVGQGELEPGSRVIISPLPSFGGAGGHIVRVPAAQLSLARSPSL